LYLLALFWQASEPEMGGDSNGSHFGVFAKASVSHATLLTLQAPPAHTGNFFEIRDSAGTIIAGFDNEGRPFGMFLKGLPRVEVVCPYCGKVSYTDELETLDCPYCAGNLKAKGIT
jgi:uncharacterized Zn-finger protein